MENKLLFELSREGRRAFSLPKCDVEYKKITELIPDEHLRASSPDLPELSEVDVVRHFNRLSRSNYGVDSGFYPLGSCTMKYNPKINEEISRLQGFTHVHPKQDEKSIQGCLEILYEMDKMLAEITGMDRMTLQPAAGAHGELTGLMIIKAYYQHKGEINRTKIIVPDSAHGTNPASASMVGFDVVQIKTNEHGGVDLDSLKNAVSSDTAGLMLTNPSTLGLFEEDIVEISRIVHEAGGLLYYDGANANAILGISRPGDMGFDVVHLNLHKTFSTPHGGGGPGSGPVGVKKDLIPYLPKPVIEFENGEYRMDYDRPLSIGKVKAFYGNFNVVLKAYAYILSLGDKGLKEVAEAAVLNANYLLHKLKDYFYLPYDRSCMHEFVISGQKQTEKGVSTLDIAKRLMDYGFHPPTIYFPLIVKEAMMFEPTETESRETMDELVEAMIKISKEVEEEPEKVKNAPCTTSIKRLDEARAVRQPRLRWEET